MSSKKGFVPIITPKKVPSPVLATEDAANYSNSEPKNAQFESN
jgi:hypothetical protein